MDTVVDDALGRPVVARWWLAGRTAVVEAAEAGGIARLGGPGGNDPLAASSRGTGQLLLAARRCGARRIVVGVGGSSSTDGGAAAVAEVRAGGGLAPATLEVACDVDVGFVDAARIFGPQKGADAAQVAELTKRLQRLVDVYRRQGTDVTTMAGAGAAGGLAGGLAVLGGQLRSGFDLVAELVDLDRRMAASDLVLTGEGQLDATTWSGKVVGGVLRRAAVAGRPVLVVAGRVATGAAPPHDLRARTPAFDVVSLVDLFGPVAAVSDPTGCVAALVRRRLGPPRNPSPAPNPPPPPAPPS